MMRHVVLALTDMALTDTPKHESHARFPHPQPLSRRRERGTSSVGCTTFTLMTLNEYSWHDQPPPPQWGRAGVGVTFNIIGFGAMTDRQANRGRAAA